MDHGRWRNCKMRLRSELMIPAVVLIIIGVVVGFLILGGSDLLGMDTDDTNVIVTLLPGIIVLFVAFYSVSISSGYMLSGAVAGLGLSLAFLLHLLDETSLIVDEPTLLITDLQILVIVVFLVLAFGAVVRER